MVLNDAAPDRECCRKRVEVSALAWGVSGDILRRRILIFYSPFVWLLL